MESIKEENSELSPTKQAELFQQDLKTCFLFKHEHASAQLKLAIEEGVDIFKWFYCPENSYLFLIVSEKFTVLIFELSETEMGHMLANMVFDDNYGFELLEYTLELIRALEPPTSSLEQATRFYEGIIPYIHETNKAIVVAHDHQNHLRESLGRKCEEVESMKENFKAVKSLYAKKKAAASNIKKEEATSNIKKEKPVPKKKAKRPEKVQVKISDYEEFLEAFYSSVEEDVEELTDCD